MPVEDAARLKVRIAAAEKARAEVEEVVHGANESLHSEVLSQQKPAGAADLVVECDNAPGLDALLFQIENISGAAVEHCTGA